MKRFAVRLALVTLGAVTVAGVVGCGSGGVPGDAPATLGGNGGLGSAPSAQPSADPVGSATGDDRDGDSAGTPGGADDSDSGTTNTGGDHGGATVTQPAGPTIVYFKVTSEPSCPAGTTLAPIEGRPVTLAWKVNRNPSVTLSVDGPGAYSSYEGAEGGETLNFPCGGQPNTYQKHTYTLTVEEDGVKRHRTITVQARINEIAVVENP